MISIEMLEIFYIDLEIFKRILWFLQEVKRYENFADKLVKMIVEMANRELKEG